MSGWGIKKANLDFRINRESCFASGSSHGWMDGWMARWMAGCRTLPNTSWCLVVHGFLPLNPGDIIRHERTGRFAVRWVAKTQVGQLSSRLAMLEELHSNQPADSDVIEVGNLLSHFWWAMIIIIIIFPYYLSNRSDNGKVQGYLRTYTRKVPRNLLTEMNGNGSGDFYSAK